MTFMRFKKFSLTLCLLLSLFFTVILPCGAITRNRFYVFFAACACWYFSIRERCVGPQGGSLFRRWEEPAKEFSMCECDSMIGIMWGGARECAGAGMRAGRGT